MIKRKRWALGLLTVCLLFCGLFLVPLARPAATVQAAETEVSYRGDINGDGDADLEDAILMQQYIIGAVTLTEYQIKVGDVNGDGKITLEDTIMICQHIIGIDTGEVGEVYCVHELVHHEGKAPTCSSVGWEAYDACTKCGYSTYREIAKLAHDYESEMIKAPTCTEAGERRYTCAVCGDTYTDPIPALDHSYASEVTKEATCTEAGVITYTCSRCFNSYTETVDALGHDYKCEITPPTCTEAGEQKFTCSTCGYSYSITTTASHDYELVETVAAGCTTDGYQLFRCSVCNEEYTIEIPAESGHNYVGVVTVAPTAEQNGEMTYTCTQCGDSYTVTLERMNTDGGYVLLIQDRLPWSTDSNAELLNELTEDQQVAGWEIVTSAEAASADFDDYDIIYIANDQTKETYNRLGALNGKLTQYVEDGGVLIYGACDQGWGSGKITYALPGGVSISTSFSRYNYIADDAHEIVTGELTGGGGLTNGMLYSTDTSHTIFDDLPEGSNVILQDANGNPTLMEYSLGKGFVIASGLTWEYTYKHEFMFSTSFAKESYDDLFAYAVKLANTCKHEYQATKTVEPTCTKGGYTVYTCALCGRSYRGDFVDAKGHAEVTIPGKEATCTETGLTEGIRCSVCGEVLKEQEVIPLKEHTVVIDEAVEATCTQTGLTEGSHCSVCGQVFKAQEVVPLKEHSYESVVTKEPTCKEVGERTYTCTVCGDSYTEEIPTVAHIYGEGVVTKEPTCSEAGELKFTCAVCGDSYTETVRALGHSYVSHEGKEPTCTEVGWKAYQTCSRCDYTTYEEIDALGHDYECRTIKQPTCTEAGEYIYTCSRCDDSYTEPIDAPGHELEYVAATEPTCEEDGNIEYYDCSRCKKYFADEDATKELTEDEVIISATGHTEGEPSRENEKDATCEEAASYEEVIYCTVCKQELSRETIKVGDPLGHSFTNYVPDNNATCTEDGTETAACDNGCGTKDTRTVEGSALGHDWEEEWTTDEMSHWRVCTRCGEKGEVGDHTNTETVDDKYLVSEATCTQGAVYYESCSVCGKASTETFQTDPLPHTPGPEATCMAPQTCTVCGTVLVEKVLHSFTDYVYNNDATCEKDGTETAYCDYGCGTTRTITVENTALGHDPEETWTTDETSHWHVCTRCNEMLDEAEHTYVEKADVEYLVSEATCTKGAVYYKSCSVCGRADTETFEYGDPLPHTAGEAVKTNEKAATCTEAGSYDLVVRCTECGNIISRETVEIPATGHTPDEPERENEKAATCVEAASYEEVIYCTVCDEELSRNKVEVGDPLGHDYVQHEGKAATCTEAGWKAYETCTRCDYTTYQELPELGHQLTHFEAADPTCEEDGCIEHWYCSRCGKYFADEDAKKELTEDEVIIPANGHVEDTPVIKNRIEATCTEDGSYDEVVYCKVCKKELSRKTIVDPALGHQWEVVMRFNETSHWYKCSHCDEMKDVGAHTYSERPIDGYLVSEATCTAKAVYYKSCSVCGMAGTETFEYGELLPHTPGPEATCTEPQTCTVCNTVLKEALGHSFTQYFSDGNATCEEDGTETAKCDRCDATDTRTDEGSAKGHNWVSHYSYDETSHWITCSRCDAKDKLGEHTYIEKVDEEYLANEATCASRAMYYKSCSICGRMGTETFEFGEFLPHSPGEPTRENEKVATCTVPGSYDMVVRCTVCNTELSRETVETTRPLGHIIIKHEAKEPTCIEVGWEAYETCSRCAYTTYVEIAALGHVLTYVERVEPTCEEIGTVEHWNCSRCNENFVDENATVDLVEIAISAKGHTPGEAVKENEKEATCEKAGSYDEVVYCTECNKELNRDTVKVGLPLGHHYEDGKCTICGALKSSEGLEVSILNNGIAYEVTGIGSCVETDIVIPSVYNGLPVTAIGESAFSDCSSLTSIAIPDSVTVIGKKAFYECTSLTSITIPDCVVSIGDWAFAYCASLTSVELGDNITSIGMYAFNECNNLTSITIPDGVTTIKNGAFNECNSLTSITIPDSVTSIGGQAFYRCYGLTNVTLGNSVMSIEILAFEGCSSLTSITIPDSVTSIGDGAFEGCSSLMSITIGDGVTSIGSSPFGGTAYYNNEQNWEDGVLYLGKYLIAADADLSGECTIKDGTTLIAESAFYLCDDLTSITIPDSVASIGASAFNGCAGLMSITVPDGVTFVGESAFNGTAYYNGEQNWENGVLYIGNYLVAANQDLSGDYTIKDGTILIADHAFYRCGGLTSVTIPDSVTSIGEYAFAFCDGLTSVTISNDVTSIGAGAFNGCSSLTIITIPDSVTSIGEYAFEGCYSLTSVTIGDGVTSIGYSAFYGCSDLTSVYVTDITAWCAIDFGNSFATPLYYADNLYQNDELVTDVVISEGVKAIGNYAFYRCTSLTSITLGDGVASIGDYAFYGCESLTSVTIGNGVTSIGDYAFYGCESLTSITLGDGVASIGDYAFYGCESLTSVTIPDSVTAIGASAFSLCKSLMSVTLGEGVTSIGESAFASCTRLASITIPDSVTAIGASAFYYNENLTSITIPESVTAIGESAFSNCASLTSITIPYSVTSIGYNLFGGCDSLISIEIPESVVFIGDRAFNHCESLLNVTIPYSVTSIGTNAFFGCNDLASAIFENQNGWSVSGTSLAAENLSDPATAAKYLRSTYYNYTWTRE